MIDLAPIRREILKQIVPDGHLENLTPEERARIGRELNQRMLGIAQGLQLGAAGLQKRAADAEREAQATSDKAAQMSADAAAKSTATKAKAAEGTKAVEGAKPKTTVKVAPAVTANANAGADARGDAPADQEEDRTERQSPRRHGRAEWPGRRADQRGDQPAAAAGDRLLDDAARSRRGAVRDRERRKDLHAHRRRPEDDRRAEPACAAGGADVDDLHQGRLDRRRDRRSVGIRPAPGHRQAGRGSRRRAAQDRGAQREPRVGFHRPRARRDRAALRPIDAQSLEAHRRRRSDCAWGLQRARAAQDERRGRPARDGVQPDGRGRRGASARGGRAGAREA